MPPKQQIPAPIDRPLSKAYLREFAGWSTAFPPGLSEPTSLRVMENAMVNRDGSLRVRPGLRYLSFDGLSPGGQLALSDGSLEVVSSHEAFFLNDGRKGYLMAVRELDGTVGFRVGRESMEEVFTTHRTPMRVYPIDHSTYGFKVPQGVATLRFPASTKYVKFLQIDNRILALSDDGEAARLFWVGTQKHAKLVKGLGSPNYSATFSYAGQPKRSWYDDPLTGEIANSFPITSTSLQIASTNRPAQHYAFGYFFTFSNEFGETSASRPRIVYTRRGFGQWEMETPAAGTMDPSGTETTNPDLAADQVRIMPLESTYDGAIAAGMTHFNVYMFTWSSQEPVPFEAMHIGSVEILRYDTSSSTWVPKTNGWRDCFIRQTPLTVGTGITRPVPTSSNNPNSSYPPSASQGVVAGDRLILVRDPVNLGRIVWTSNQMGEYLNFTPTKGGGFKTLTSGELYVPAAVKLWQNPESKDTITILCAGLDGHSTAYYMAPAQVAQQADATNIMGFEETTATPGTVSPFGCEVLNNGLYHPVEQELTKSTASNYNINHKPMTDNIVNMWKSLRSKDRIISSQLDNRLYYLVHNPYGSELETGCVGNEVWVLDTATDTGNWSRWLVQGSSLRKVEFDGKVMMSLSRPEGVFAFDEDVLSDQYVDASTLEVLERPIPWKIETNTQGANRAHDAWAHLQQCSLTLGNFSGKVRWGIRGVDVHGRKLEVHKITQSDEVILPGDLAFDREDHLQVRRDMKEWRFFAESVVEAGVVQPSAGQLSLVQYRYTPVSVNVGYETGSVETFEYGRNVAQGNDAVHVDGVPQPLNGTQRM